MPNPVLRLFEAAPYRSELGNTINEIYDIFWKAAKRLDELIPENAEKTIALRRLSECKDYVLKAVLFNGEGK